MKIAKIAVLDVSLLKFSVLRGEIYSQLCSVNLSGIMDILPENTFFNKSLPFIVLGIKPSLTAMRFNKLKNLLISDFGLSGKDGGKMKNLCDIILAPSNSTEKIQEVHIMIGHIICSLVEKKYFNK